MKVAIIGAGIFGISSALLLKDAGFDVDVYEQQSDILCGASFCNQFRLHRGYHYPRSPETVDTLLNSVSLFEDFYKGCIINLTSYKNYYCISKKNSFVSSDQYLDFCNSKKLEYNIVDNLPYVNKDNIDLSLLVDENIICYKSLKNICYEKLINNKIIIKFNIKFKESMKDEYDYVVNCTYCRTNDNSEQKKNYQFELCEKIIVKLSKRLNAISIVIMDGPFMCIDPYGNSGNHLLGNVVHAIHHRNIGEKPEIPEKYKCVLDKGFNKVSYTRFDKFIKSGKKFIPDLEDAEYISSMFTVRTVLPNLEKTDARPTLVSKQGKVIDVFSGKIDTCVTAAKQVLDLINRG